MSSHEISYDPRGLTSDEVARLTAAGQVNVAATPTSRTVKEIVKDNCFTLFNAILTVCLVIVLLVGSWRDGVFAGVLILNAATGIVSEIRAKRTLDKLAILSTSPVAVIRDGAESQVPPTEIVAGDLLVLRAGDQIPTDATVVDSRGLLVDEAILTGESVPIRKEDGDEVLSGSSVTAGEARARADRVGADSWANSMGSQVKRFELAHSELSAGIDKILRVITWALPIMIVILGWSQIDWSNGIAGVFRSGQWRGALLAIVAALVGMIPQGLVLLTSINFAAAAMKLARRKVLVQELPAVEILARVDVLCLDKTGTITTGEITCQGVAAPGATELADVAYGLGDEARSALALLAADKTNATAKALAGAIGDPVGEPDVRVPFSSATKWSAIARAGTTWVMGAPEILADACTNGDQMALTTQHFASSGARVVALARAEGTIEATADQLPAGLEGAGLLILAEDIRPDAAETLRYFAEQGVAIKVISGDSPVTVRAIARRAGLGDDIAVCDARTLPAPPTTIEATERPTHHRRHGRKAQAAPRNAFDDAVENTQVFGRVTPEQKRALVHALQRGGHTVAMTGDGVNDALALKDADLGIAMGSGAQATKAAAKVVLLDSAFSRLPDVVAEGRRVLGNMERVSTLFLAKTTWAFIVAMTVSIAGLSYPFLPRHLTLIGVFTIGVPAFLLALAPSHTRYRPGFLKRVSALVLPCGTIIAALGLGVYVGSLHLGHRLPQTLTTLTITGCSLALLAVLARPLKSWRGILVATMAVCVVLATLVPQARHFFALQWPSFLLWLAVLLVIAVGVALIWFIGQWWSRRYYPHVTFPTPDRVATVAPGNVD